MARCKQLCVDAVLLVAIFGPLLMFALKAEPFEQGFFCDDPSIRYPYLPSTISTLMLVFTWLFAGIGLFAVVEFVYGFHVYKMKLCPGVIMNILKVLAVYVIGSALNIFLFDIIKITVGRPRPHFIDVCSPDFQNINCSAGYITDYTCLNLKGFSERHLSEARKSFPSGHAAVAAYCAFFLAFYSEQRLSRVQWSVMLKVVPQAGVAFYALYTMATRVIDNKHYMVDVTAGAVLGILTSVWTVAMLGRHIGFYDNKWWNKPETDKSEKGSINDDVKEGLTINENAV